MTSEMTSRSACGAHARRTGFFRAALVALTLTMPLAAGAQTAPALAQKVAMATDPLTVQEKQGLGCMVVGSMGAFGAYYYSDVLMIAVTAGLVPAAGLPSLPFILGGFVATCGVGATMTPAVLRLMP